MKNAVASSIDKRKFSHGFKDYNANLKCLEVPQSPNLAYFTPSRDIYILKIEMQIMQIDFIETLTLYKKKTTKSYVARCCVNSSLTYINENIQFARCCIYLILQYLPFCYTLTMTTNEFTFI